MTNGFFLEEEFDLTRGTKYTGLGSENLINGNGSWDFHANSLIYSFEGEVENGKMKYGTLRSVHIETLGVPPFLKSLKGVITEGGLAQAIEEDNGTEDKIWDASFIYDGEWKNNKQHGNGRLEIEVCVCVPKSSIQIGNLDFHRIISYSECDYFTNGFNVIKLFSPSLV